MLLWNRGRGRTGGFGCGAPVESDGENAMRVESISDVVDQTADVSADWLRISPTMKRFLRHCPLERVAAI